MSKSFNRSSGIPVSIRSMGVYLWLKEKYGVDTNFGKHTTDNVNFKPFSVDNYKRACQHIINSREMETMLDFNSRTATSAVREFMMNIKGNKCETHCMTFIPDSSDYCVLLPMSDDHINTVLKTYSSKKNVAQLKWISHDDLVSKYPIWGKRYPHRFDKQEGFIIAYLDGENLNDDNSIINEVNDHVQVQFLYGESRENDLQCVYRSIDKSKLDHILTILNEE